MVLCVDPDEPRLPWTSNSGPSKCRVEDFLADFVALDAQRLLNTSDQARRAVLIALAGGAKPGLQLAQLGPGGHVRHGRKDSSASAGGASPRMRPNFFHHQLRGLFGLGNPWLGPMAIRPRITSSRPHGSGTGPSIRGVASGLGNRL